MQPTRVFQAVRPRTPPAAVDPAPTDPPSPTSRRRRRLVVAMDPLAMQQRCAALDALRANAAALAPAAKSSRTAAAAAAAAPAALMRQVRYTHLHKSCVPTRCICQCATSGTSLQRGSNHRGHRIEWRTVQCSAAAVALHCAVTAAHRSLSLCAASLSLSLCLCVKSTPLSPEQCSILVDWIAKICMHTQQVTTQRLAQCTATNPAQAAGVHSRAAEEAMATHWNAL